MAKQQYSQQVIDEAVALYESGEPVAEINRTFDLEKTTIYHFLKRKGVPARAKRSVDHITDVVLPVRTNDLVLTTDKEGWVIGAERSNSKKHLYTIEFSGFLEISADTFEEALATARKRDIVKRIHSIRER